MPATSSGPPSGSTFDLDSLCSRFTKSLVIDESPPHSSQHRSSIFSLPVVPKEGEKANCSRRKSPKGRHSGVRNSRERAAHNPTSPEVTKPRQLSAPPSFSPPCPTSKSNPRRASAPASTPKRTPVSSQPADSTLYAVSTSSLTPTAPTPGCLDAFHSGPTTPIVHLQTSLGSPSGQATQAPWDLSYPLSGPITPPSAFPDLFSEPIVIPSTPVRLSPRSSLTPMSDSLLQFQPQYDYFSDLSLISAAGYGGTAIGLVTGSLFSKDVFGTPLGTDHLFHGISVPMLSELSENFFNTYPIS